MTYPMPKNIWIKIEKLETLGCTRINFYTDNPKTDLDSWIGYFDCHSCPYKDKEIFKIDLPIKKERIKK